MPALLHTPTPGAGDREKRRAVSAGGSHPQPPPPRRRNASRRTLHEGLVDNMNQIPVRSVPKRTVGALRLPTSMQQGCDRTNPRRPNRSSKYSRTRESGHQEGGAKTPSRASTDDRMPGQRKTDRCAPPFWTTLLGMRCQRRWHITQLYQHPHYRPRHVRTEGRPRASSLFGEPLARRSLNRPWLTSTEEPIWFPTTLSTLSSRPVDTTTVGG